MTVSVTSNVQSTDAADRKIYADFNNATFEARVLHVEVKAGKYGEYATVTCVTNTQDDTEGTAIRFNSTNGALSLAKSGALMAGRRVHVSGNIADVETHYVKDNTVHVLARKRIVLRNAQVTLGAKPKSAK